ncbi:thylakoid membrane photosystem I accumulation factor [Tumidithrix helvetica PCC 7403]|uniref:thylakoid membrane photosystem I accumulation factor n=1 Tax=Tumidithrix helvetica TaxID=3457545 RepID=UPI003C94EC91
MNSWLSDRLHGCLSLLLGRGLARFLQRGLTLAIAFLCIVGLSGLLSPSASAVLTDDRYDGNIFALYGGNGSLVPARVNLKESLRLGRGALLLFYVDDSSDCKLFSPLLNQMQAFYTKNLTLIPVPVDSLDPDTSNYSPTDEGFYYRGLVPQTVLINALGEKVFDQEGRIEFPVVDVAVRQMLGLPGINPAYQFRNTKKQINEINP